ncbi:hypothetical protein FWH58_00230 [Candidatus Saccharibacteria bacterium]|nr:hypothetical protein [Candidatus Saccharibacteria bacterium]
MSIHFEGVPISERGGGNDLGLEADWYDKQVERETAEDLNNVARALGDLLRSYRATDYVIPVESTSDEDRVTAFASVLGQYCAQQLENLSQSIALAIYNLGRTEADDAARKNFFEALKTPQRIYIMDDTLSPHVFDSRLADAMEEFTKNGGEISIIAGYVLEIIPSYYMFTPQDLGLLYELNNQLDQLNDESELPGAAVALLLSIMDRTSTEKPDE